MKIKTSVNELCNNLMIKVLMFAPDPIKELTQLRYTQLSQLVSQLQGIAYYEYLDDGLLPITNDELKQRAYKAVNSSNGENLRKKKGISKEQHFQLECDELSTLADLNAQYESCKKTLLKGKRPEIILEDFFKEIDTEEALRELSGLSSSNFGRKLQEYVEAGYIRKCKGADLHRALKSRLSYVPVLQVINQALRKDFDKPQEKPRKRL